MPTPPNKHLGEWRSIEFECVWTITKNYNFNEFLAKKKYTKWVSIGHDSSIEVNDNDDNYESTGTEIRVTFRTGRDQIVRDICGWLLANNAYVNKSCGTHVHFDMRGLDEISVAEKGIKLARCVGALKELLPKSRKNSMYCTDKTFLNNHYSFVNLGAYEEHRTIEVRGHNGTINADKILNWIKLCENIMNSKKPAKEIRTLKELLKYETLDPSVRTYIKNRSKDVKRKEAVNAQ